MIGMRHHLRTIGIALSVLALTAGAAFGASAPRTYNPSLTTANTTEVSETTESDTTESETTDSDTTESDTTGSESTDRHGGVVSAAAQMVTPAGFANHGAFVACVAHMKTATLATIDWSTVTPAACAATAHGEGHAHSH
jgi:hypothetical protein